MAGRNRRTAVADEYKIKLACNQCPICWMPLQVEGTGDNDSKWKDVQIIFKGKPAFSVANGSVYFGRPVVVFGIHASLAGGTKSNAELCHFVHFASLGDNRATNLWKLGLGADASSYNIICDVRDRLEPIDRFANILFSVGQTHLNGGRPGGIFAKAFNGPESKADTFFTLLHANGKNMAKVAEVTDLMLNDTHLFAGCTDCNKMMSTPMRFVPGIFECLFGCSSSDFSKESMTHYIMLCGALEESDKRQKPDGSYEFVISDPVRGMTWSFRYILMWCVLQILICKWQMSYYKTRQRHHTNYMLSGVIDFYISLCFFAMHKSDFVARQSKDLTFQDFHFCYASMCPFYFERRVPLGIINPTLSSSILRDDMVHSESLDQIQDQVKIICNKLFDYWLNYMRDVSSILLDPSNDQESFFTYFTPVDQLQSRKNELLRLQQINVETFATHMSPYKYWLHFRHITMPRIAALCGEFNNSLVPVRAKVLWCRWCQMLNTSTKKLQSQLQARREWIQRREMELK
jgi:hypothetical protein